MNEQPTPKIPADPRPNSVPIERCSEQYDVNGAQLAPETAQVANYSARPMRYPDASQPRNPAQGGL